MKDIKEMMNYRADIKVVDATLRDGGLVNEFYFADDFAKALYEANAKAGVDYMEFGYKASKNLFDKSAFGKWKFCEEEDLRAIVGNNESPMKVAVMADVGRCDFRTDFLPKSESVIDMVRVACYIHQIPSAVEMINYFNELGYETTCNIMAISQASFNQIDDALTMLGESKVDVIYLVDSYGSLFPENAAELAKKYLEVFVDVAKKNGKAGNGIQLINICRYLVEQNVRSVQSVQGRVRPFDILFLNHERIVLGFEKNESYGLKEGFESQILISFVLLENHFINRQIKVSLKVDVLYSDEKKEKFAADCSFFCLQEEDTRFLYERATRKLFV